MVESAANPAQIAEIAISIKAGKLARVEIVAKARKMSCKARFLFKKQGRKRKLAAAVCAKCFV